jgi:putative methyltransferase (TIGR04325 family)
VSLKDWSAKVWEGVYKDFEEAAAETTVFEDSVWQEKVFNRALAMIAENNKPSIISNSATTTEYALPFFVAMQVNSNVAFKVLDFGGGLGTSYIPLVPMLPESTKLDFLVVENKTICRMGDELFFNDNQIRFLHSIPTEEQFDLVHAGSSIQYIEDWLNLLDSFVATNAQYVLFSDLPAGDNKTFVTAQWFHGRRIPVRFWNFKEFSAAMDSRGYDLIFKSNYRGYYMDKNATLPTHNFEPEYQLKQFIQLVFRKKK